MRSILTLRKFATAFLVGLVLASATAARAEDMPLDRVIETMKTSIREKNDAMRNRMFFKLRALGSKAVPALVGVLKENEPEVSDYAAFTLGWIADPTAIPELLAFLERGASSQKRHALQALGNMAWGTKQEVRARVHELAVGKMIPYLDSSDLAVRRDAAYGLGLAGDKKAIAPLRKLVDHEDKVLRFLAQEAIDRIESVQRNN